MPSEPPIGTGKDRCGVIEDQTEDAATTRECSRQFGRIAIDAPDAYGGVTVRRSDATAARIDARIEDIDVVTQGHRRR